MSWNNFLLSAGVMTVVTVITVLRTGRCVWYSADTKVKTGEFDASLGNRPGSYFLATLSSISAS